MRGKLRQAEWACAASGPGVAPYRRMPAPSNRRAGRLRKHYLKVSAAVTAETKSAERRANTRAVHEAAYWLWVLAPSCAAFCAVTVWSRSIPVVSFAMKLATEAERRCTPLLLTKPSFNT